MAGGLDVLTGGTDTHLLQLDLRSTDWTGKDAEERLHEVKLTVNRNTVPFDERKPTIASGVRIGSPAATMRGMDADDFGEIGRIIVDALGDSPDLEALRARTDVETPLEHGMFPRISGKKVAVCPILRAGVGMLDGVLSLISSARVGFIGMYRDEETLEPVEYYAKLPADVAERDVILLDPMLATGNSTAAAIRTVKNAGATSVRLIAIIAAPEGVEKITRDHPDVQIVVAAIDRGLNEKGFIVPGLGDAGDRLYGTK
jgi:uracil phosphoribosyltransferase